MPCSDHGADEYYRRKEMAVWLQHTSDALRRYNGSKDEYHPSDDVAKLTSRLCYEMGRLDEDGFDTFVYDGRNKEARKLADWWEDHQKADNKRKQREDTRLAERDAKKRAWDKLTPAERGAVGLNKFTP